MVTQNANYAELLKLTAPIRRFSTRLDRRTLDLTRPKWEVGRFRKDMETAVDQIDVARLGDAFNNMLEQVAKSKSGRASRRIRELTLPRPRGNTNRMLCEYLDGIEREVPLAVAIVFASSAFTSLEYVEQLFAIGARMQDAAAARGE